MKPYDVVILLKMEHKPRIKKSSIIKRSSIIFMSLGVSSTNLRQWRRRTSVTPGNREGEEEGISWEIYNHKKDSLFPTRGKVTNTTCIKRLFQHMNTVYV